MDEIAGKNAQWFKDAAERVFWTTAQVGLASILVYVGELEPWVAVPVATGLTVLKTLIAKKIGNENDASIGRT